MKRAKGKIKILSGSSDGKKKDFKFERIPYISNCVLARSSTFGAFAAIRKDSKIMSSDIGIAKLFGQSNGKWRQLLGKDFDKILHHICKSIHVYLIGELE